MEIGSVLELDKWELYGIAKQKKPFWLPFMKENKDYKSVFYQSGRNAIEALLLFLKENKGIKKMLLPDYMCETVKDAGKRAGVALIYYKINKEYCFSVNEIENKLTEDTCLFIAHYFGKKMDKEVLSDIRKWKAQGNIIIEDITLSLFSSDDEKGVGFGTYVLGSLRKWLPIPDGGFVTSCTGELPEKIVDTTISKYTDYYLMVQTMKKEYVQGGYKNKNLKSLYMDYYALSIKELFSDYQLYPMSEWSKNYLQNFDISGVVSKRMENYDYLFEKLSQLSRIELKIQRQEGYLPFGMIIQTENRDQLLQYMINNDIYCNVHWRLEPSEENPDLTFLAQHSITIPCDQRYGLEELEHIVSVLERWEEK